MFGLLISGRLVDTGFREVDATHAVIDVLDADNFNHVVVFLTGQQPFPDGTGGAVYFCWPPSHPEQANSEPAWQYLGMISNQKPSAIFKISKLKTKTVNPNIGMSFSGNTGIQQSVINAQLGISIESFSTLENLASSASAASTETSPASSVPAALEFSQKMVESLLNYTASFAISADQARIKSNETYVPFSAVQNWFTNFERRLQQNPNFWKN